MFETSVPNNGATGDISCFFDTDTDSCFL